MVGTMTIKRNGWKYDKPIHYWHLRTIEYAVKAYGFLVGDEETITPGEFADRITGYYAPSARHAYIVGILDKYREEQR